MLRDFPAHTRHETIPNFHYTPDRYQQFLEALCIIVLDTIMPALSAYNFGDSFRFGAATSPEDETDLPKMEMSLKLFRVYAKGFLSACPA